MAFSIHSFLALAYAILHVVAEASPSLKAFSVPLTKREVKSASSTHPLERRAFSAEIDNAQSNLLYLIDVEIGTPPQKFKLQLDTGSSDIWIPWVASAACNGRTNRCVNGAYDETKSSTYVDIAQDQFEISYVDKTKIVGDYINETITVGGVTLTGMTMGLAKQAAEQDTTSPFQGILGVGFDQGEAIFAQTGMTYPNFISQLKAQGHIQTKAYSLWLNDRESTGGNILFGAVDNAKYNGALTVLPLQPDIRGSISSFTVVFDNFNVVGANNKVQYTSNSTIPVIFDSGTTLTYLPDAVAAALANGVNAVESASYGVVVPCDVGNSPATLNFQFGSSNGPIIVAEISQFVLPFPSTITIPKFRSGKTACRWGILPSGSNPNLFGDTFLRSAYLTYNIDGKQMGIAQTKFNVSDSDIKEIVATSSLPGASSTASGAAQQTHTGPIYLSAGGGSAASATNSAIAAGSTTGTFDLGSPTAKPAASSASGSKQSAGEAIRPLSRVEVRAILSYVLAFTVGACYIFC